MIDIPIHAREPSRTQGGQIVRLLSGRLRGLLSAHHHVVPGSVAPSDGVIEAAVRFRARNGSTFRHVCHWSPHDFWPSDGDGCKSQWPSFEPDLNLDAILDFRRYYSFQDDHGREFTGFMKCLLVRFAFHATESVVVSRMRWRTGNPYREMAKEDSTVFRAVPLTDLIWRPTARSITTYRDVKGPYSLLIVEPIKGAPIDLPVSDVEVTLNGA